MLTGVWFDKHGVTNNSFKGSQIDRYPPFNVLMKRKNKNFKMASFIMWKPIEKHMKIKLKILAPFGAVTGFSTCCRFSWLLS